MKHLDFYKEGTPLFSIKNRWILRILFYISLPLGLQTFIYLFKELVITFIIATITFFNNHYIIGTIILLYMLWIYLFWIYPKVIIKIWDVLYGTHFFIINNEIYRKRFGGIFFGKFNAGIYEKIESKDIKYFVKGSKGFNVITNNETFFLEFIQRRKLYINEIYKIHEDEILQYLNENFTNKEL